VSASASFEARSPRSKIHTIRAVLKRVLRDDDPDGGPAPNPLAAMTAADIVTGCSERLHELADRAMRLPPPSHHAFNEARDELATQIREIATALARHPRAR
jgi:hypothetical protein